MWETVGVCYLDKDVKEGEGITGSITKCRTWKGTLLGMDMGMGWGMVRDGGEEVLAIKDESSERLAEAGS